MPRGKWSPYDHGSRAVCIAHWPGHFVPKKTSAIAMYCDFVPTFIDLAAGQSQVPLDGKSLKSLWLGEREKHRQSAFISNVHPFWQKAIVTEQYKLIWTAFPNEDHIHSNFGSTKFFGKAWSEWKEVSEKNRDVAAKITRVLHPKRYELYDIQNAPYEVHDLAESGQHQNVKLGLLTELKQLMADAGESLEPKKPLGEDEERTRRRKKR